MRSGGGPSIRGVELGQAVFAFSLMAAVVVLTPGLDVMLVLRQSLRGERSVALATGAGICLGALLWGIAAAAGLGALFVASQTAYAVVRWAGVVYLAWLAFGYFRAALRAEPALGDDTAAAKPGSAWEGFITGLLTDLLNPKMAVFYLTVLPLFLPAGYPPVLIGSLLAGIHAAEAMLWFVVIIVAAQSVRGFLNSRRGARVVDSCAAVAMLGFSAGLALEHRG